MRRAQAAVTCSNTHVTDGETEARGQANFSGQCGQGCGEAVCENVQYWGGRAASPSQQAHVQARV